MATDVSSESYVCVSPVVARLVGDLKNHLEKRSLPLDGATEEVQSLHGRLAAIQAVLEDAEEKQLRNTAVKDWLSDLKESVLDAEDTLDSFITEASLQQGRHQVVSLLEVPSDVFKTRVVELLARLDGITKKKEKLLLSRERDSYHGNYGSWPKTDASHLEDKHFVVGRENDKSNIVKMLLADQPDNGSSSDIPVIPIVGMGGLGKTTLAHLVFNDGVVKERFDSRMWVCTTDDFDLKRVLREMIKFHSKMDLDLNFSEATLESRLLEFVRGKPFLLVLDDVWPENCGDWEKLKDVLNKGGKGSRVLITSRVEKVSEIMGANQPYNLEYLPDDMCRSLFNKIAFKGQGCFDGRRHELEGIGKKIVEKCKGLPLAVKAMAGLLRGVNDAREWKSILRSEIWEVDATKLNEKGRVRVLPALQLSYYHLPSTLKQCFAYCSIFPKAYTFNRHDIIKQWMAESFLLPDVGALDKSPQEVGLEYFDEFLMRAFFHSVEMDGKVIYMMHDLIHDMAVSVSKPYCVQVKRTGSTRSALAARHVSLMCEDAEQPLREIIGQSKKLRTLLFPTGHLKTFGQVLDMVFHSLPYLRLLDLSSSELKELPENIAELKLLRYLDLSNTDIHELPNSVCRLYNLETLKLLRCRWLYKLPSNISDLVNLCHLELDELFWFKATSLPPRMGNLTKLQNLNSFIVGKDPGHGIGELSRMSCLDGTLHISKLENASDAAAANMKDKSGLKKVVFQWSAMADQESGKVDHARILEDLRPHTNVEELQISYFNGSAFPGWLRNGVLQNLVKVSFVQCLNCKILSLGDLPCLREINLKGLRELEEWRGECMFLGRLNISSCPKLRALPPMFPSLGAMKIKGCESLEALPVAPFLQFITLESNRSLADWQEVSVTFSRRTEQGEEIEHGQKWSYIDVLEMTVIGCPRLEGLPKIFAPQKLEIHRCERIQELPAPQFARRLQHLAIVGCHDGTLVREIPFTESLYSLVISEISNLSAFPGWPLLPGLKALYIHDCRDLKTLSAENGNSLQALASVKLLSIQNCPNLTVLVVEGLPPQLECLSIRSCPNLMSLGSTGSLTSLTKLKDVYISDCLSLDSLPDDGFPSSVQHLCIGNCPLLRDQCDRENEGPEWRKIKDIPDLEMVDLDTPAVSPEYIHPDMQMLEGASTSLSNSIHENHFHFDGVTPPSSKVEGEEGTSSSSSVQIKPENIQVAFSTLRSHFGLDPVAAGELELESSEMDEAFDVIRALDESYGLTSHQVERLDHFVKDWRNIVGTISITRKVHQELLQQQSASDLIKTSLSDAVSRHETLKQSAEVLAKEYEEDLVKIQQLEDRLAEVKAQKSEIESKRLANFVQAKKLRVELSQLTEEAGQDKKRIVEAEASLASADQQWGAFLDTIAEVTSLFV